jgi:alkylation response protein AidB-like acyl-CoA dehydrogenase
MRFRADEETALFAESVRGVLAGWEGPREPRFGDWWDERNEALDAALAALGWSELWASEELLGAAVAGGAELGRAVAPLCLVDDATLGGPLCIGGRARHAAGRVAGGVPEPSLDGTGTLREVDLPLVAEPERLRAWGVVTLAYLAGVAAVALERTLQHTRSREQFGAPLAALPGVQARLADAALVADGIELAAWHAATADRAFPRDALLWAGGACREATAFSLQAHGAVGFALESGLHRAFRRAKTVQVWTEGLLRALR